MSTILNALKRVEAKSRAEDGQQIPAAMAGRTAVSGKKLRLGLVLTLAVVTLLAGAAFLWFYTDRPSGESASFEAAPPEPRAEKAPRERTRETPAPAPTPVARRAEEKPAIQDLRDRRPSRSTTQALVNAKTDLTAPTYIPPDPEGRTLRGRPPEPLPEEPPALPARPAPDAPPSPQEDLYASAEVLPKDTLQLQAISWSDIPGDRITIITGQILREGQAIEGYSVIEIRPDDVIVEKAGERWKLVYGSR